MMEGGHECISVAETHFCRKANARANALVARVWLVGSPDASAFHTANEWCTRTLCFKIHVASCMVSLAIEQDQACGATPCSRCRRCCRSVIDLEQPHTVGQLDRVSFTAWTARKAE